MEKLLAVIVGLLMVIRSVSGSSGGSVFPGGSDRIYYYVNFNVIDVADRRFPDSRDTEVRWAWIEALCRWAIGIKYEAFNNERFQELRESLRFELSDRPCGGSSCLQPIGSDHFSLCNNPAHIPRVIYKLGLEYGEKSVEYGEFLKLAEQFLTDYPGAAGYDGSEIAFIHSQMVETARRQQALLKVPAAPAAPVPAASVQIPAAQAQNAAAAAAENPAASGAKAHRPEMAKSPPATGRRQQTAYQTTRQLQTAAERSVRWALWIALIALLLKSRRNWLPS